MPKVLSFSDWHLACKDDIDNYSGIEYFYRLKEKIFEIKPDMIIALGDLYECWQGEGLSEIERVYAIEKRYPAVIDFIKNQCINIVGNHDWVLKSIRQEQTFYRYPDKIILEYPDKKVLFIHGHQFDTEFTNIVGRPVTFIFGICESIFGKCKMLNIENYFQRLKLKLLKKSDEDKFIQRACEYAESLGCTHIICGHTHNKKVVIRNGITYINTGCGVNGETTALLFDTDTGKATFLDI